MSKEGAYYVPGSARTGTTAGGLSIAFSRPTEAQGNDTLVVHCVGNTGALDFSGPTGWVEGLTEGDTGFGGAVTTTTFYRKLPADISSEPSTYTFSIAGTTNRDLQGGIVAIRGSHATSYDDGKTTTNYAGVSGTIIEPVTLASTTGYSLISYSWTVTPADAVPGIDAATTLRYDVVTTGSNKRRTKWSDELGPTTTSATPQRSGTITFTGSSVESGRIAHTVAIRRDPPPGVPTGLALTTSTA